MADRQPGGGESGTTVRMRNVSPTGHKSQMSWRAWVTFVLISNAINHVCAVCAACGTRGMWHYLMTLRIRRVCRPKCFSVSFRFFLLTFLAFCLFLCVYYIRCSINYTCVCRCVCATVCGIPQSQQQPASNEAEPFSAHFIDSNFSRSSSTSVRRSCCNNFRNDCDW